ncbi:hypothetical protein LOD99_8510 [Oopsacas minuta]|uniref:FACT complex subunit SPT16 C-terminal domain-containing protein n=1 Tax=Oopsacas minuta TaxID=111878 RepID=A0AAV7JH97_9METZ|nr:hypothetical protein LOD99_8510 [Oopsacas minuta]
MISFGIINYSSIVFHCDHNSDGATDSDDNSEEYNPSESDLSPTAQNDVDSSNSEEYTSQESESGSEQFTGSDESSGKDWSDLEEQARREDKARDNEAEEDRREAVVSKKRPNTAHGNNEMNKKRRMNFPY